MISKYLSVERKADYERIKQSWLWKEGIGFFNAFVVAMVIRTFLYQPFSIPSGSMYPTLMVGDFLFVSKFCYGYSNHTFPFAPNMFNDRVMGREPRLGDVVVFHNPKHTEADGKVNPVDYIKRLVGKPGDRIQVKQGVLHINSKPVILEKIEDYHMTDEDGRFLVIPQYIETLPNGMKHRILKAKLMGSGRLDNTEEFIVPEGHYFLMGDNRDNSSDSRVMKAVGFVPSKYVIGRAEILFFSTEAKWTQPWTWPFMARYNRVLNVIR